MKSIRQRAPRAKQTTTTTKPDPDAPIPLRPVPAGPSREYLAGIVSDTVERLQLEYTSPPGDFEPGQAIMEDVVALVDVARLALRNDGGNNLHDDEIDRTLWLAERLLRFGRAMEDAKEQIRELRAAERLAKEEAAHA